MGLIPAHAGKTNEVIGRYGTVWAHPRSRGENPLVETIHSCESGSSPLTRGKPHQAFRRQSDDGLIPAHAGKTAPNPLVAHILQAHPRSRGENLRRAGVR